MVIMGGGFQVMETSAFKLGSGSVSQVSFSFKFDIMVMIWSKDRLRIGLSRILGLE